MRGLAGLLLFGVSPFAQSAGDPHTYGVAALKPEDAEKLKYYETELSGLDNRTESISQRRRRSAAERENQAKQRKLSAEYPYLPKVYAVSEGQSVDAKIMERGERVGLNFQYTYSKESFLWLLKSHGGLEVEREYASPDGRFLTAICRK
jgi:hypothetical protein